MKAASSDPLSRVLSWLVLALAGSVGACSGTSSGGAGGDDAGAGGASQATSSSGASSGSAGSSASGSGSSGGASGSRPGDSGSSSGSSSDAGPDSGSPNCSQPATAPANANCSPPAPPPSGDSVTLDMALALGVPTYRASGFIYGIAQDGSEPPNSTLADIKIQSLRVGGAQIGCPNGGYVNGQYTARWNAVKAYYAKAKAIGAKVLLLVHDLWGADGACNVPHYPGDGGDWTQYTSFLSQVISDAQANGMTGPDVRWELWNEPDLSIFWKGTQAQWLEMWKRGYTQVRAAIADAVFEGPSVATGPGGSWASAFLDYVKTNNVVPELHELARRGRRQRPGERRQYDDGSAIEAEHHREGLRRQRVRNHLGAEPRSLRLVHCAPGARQHRRSAWQLGPGRRPVRGNGRSGNEQLAAEQPVVDLQALRRPDGIADQRHRGERRSTPSPFRTRARPRPSSW